MTIFEYIPPPSTSVRCAQLEGQHGEGVSHNRCPMISIYSGIYDLLRHTESVV